MVNLAAVRLLRLAHLQVHLILGIEQSLLALVGAGLNQAAALAHAVHDAPECLWLAALFVVAGRLGAEHGGTVDDGSVDVARYKHGHVARGGHEVHEDGVLALRAGHEDGGNLVARLVHLLNDLAGLHGNKLHGGIVPERHVVEALVAVESNHDTLHVGIGNGGSVTPQVTVEEVVAAEVCHGRGVLLLGHLLEVRVEVIVNVLVLGSGECLGLVEGRVNVEHMTKQLASGRLPALGHPVIGQQHVAVRAPDARNKDGLFGHGQVAGGGTGDGGESGKGLRQVVVRDTGVELIVAEVDLGANSANPAGVGINDTASYGNALGKAELVGGLLAERTNTVASASKDSVLEKKC